MIGTLLAILVASFVGGTWTSILNHYSDEYGSFIWADVLGGAYRLSLALFVFFGSLYAAGCLCKFLIETY